MIKHYNYKFLLIFFAGLFLTACAANTTPIRQVLNNHDKVNIKSNRILLNSTQREIVMQHNNWFNSDLEDPYAPMDSGPILHHNDASVPPGLLNALVIAGIQHHQARSALTSMASVRNVLEDFDFLNYFNGELRKSVTKVPWLNVQKQEIKYNLKGTESDIVAASDENTTLFIGTTYALNSVFRQLEIIAYVKLVQKPVDNQKPRTLYANNFLFINRLPEYYKNASENKERWIKNNGAMLKTKLRDAASLLSNMIAMDIGNSNIEAYTPNRLITFRLNGINTKGSLIKKQNGYYIIVLSSKVVVAVNSDDIVNL